MKKVLSSILRKDVARILKDAVRIQQLDSDMCVYIPDPEPITILAHNGQRFAERHEEDED